MTALPGGITLCMDASEGMLLVVVSDARGRVVHARETEAASQGVEKLAPMLGAALEAVGASPPDITRVACVKGPGSFTGLRLATTTAAALARSTGALQAGIARLPLLALECANAVREAGPFSLLLVLTHARRNLVYAQAFSGTGTRLAPVTDLAVLPLAGGDAAERFLRRLAEARDGGELLIAGSGVAQNRETLDILMRRVAPSTTVLETTRPRPETLALASLEEYGAVYGPDDIVPLYARAPDAESNLPELAKRLGIDPVEAVRKLHALTSAGPE